MNAIINPTIEAITKKVNVTILVMPDINIITKPKEMDYYSIKANEEKFIDFEFMLNRDGVIDSSVILQAELTWFDQDNNQIYVYDTSINITLNPQLIIDARLYYYTPDGDQIGYGPLPPEVDEATSYWLSIKLWPTFGSLDSMELVASLGEGVSLKNYNTIAGEISIDNQISWQVNDFTDDIYSTIPRLNLQLEVIPEESQIGGIISLLRNISATGIITDSGVVLEQNRANIGNDMSFDTYQPNNGRVID